MYVQCTYKHAQDITMTHACTCVMVISVCMFVCTYICVCVDRQNIQYDYLNVAAQAIYSRAWCMGLIISYMQSYLTTRTVHLQRFYQWLIDHK